MNIEQARFNMIEQQIRPWDVLDQDILTLLGVVKRENFVPSAYRNLAFTDMEIPLGNIAEGEVMLAPRVEARLLQDLQLRKHERVLEIGTGSGFMAALLAHRAAHVTTLEISPSLAKLADERLYQALVINTKVINIDACDYIAREPFDVIVLSGSVAEVPQSLLKLLKVGGRMAAIVGDEPVMRAQIITRNSDDNYSATVLFDTVAPRLKGFSASSAFTF
jgi:protein-L-isoaspartate(D-aspartate) O-methyltransferase